MSSTAEGSVRAYYDPRISKKGIMISAGKAPKRQKDPSDYAAIGQIFNPDALPMYKVGAT